MEVRAAAESDVDRLKELWLAFDREHPSPEYEDVDEAVELAEVEECVREHVALLAEDGDAAAGFVLARMRDPTPRLDQRPLRDAGLPSRWCSKPARAGRRVGATDARGGRHRARRPAVER